MPEPITTRKTTGIYGAPPGHEKSIGGLPYWRATNEYGGTTIEEQEPGDAITYEGDVFPDGEDPAEKPA
jgi:hypothetical protein